MHAVLMMPMRAILIVLCLFAGINVAFAQGAIQQMGPAFPNHISMWSGNGLQMDAIGVATAPNVAPPNSILPGTLPSGLGVVNGSTGVCDFSAYLNAPNAASHCLGFDGSGNALLDIEGHNNSGGSPSLTIRLSGIDYPFPSTGGNVVGPTSPIPAVGAVAVWNGGSAIADAKAIAASATILRSADTSWTAFGTPAFVVTNNGGQNAIVGFTVGDTAGSSLPQGVAGYGKVTVPNANAFGVYGLGELSPGVGQPGQAVAAEFTCRNNSGTPSGSIVCNALQVTAGGNFPSGNGISIGLEGGPPVTTTSFANSIFIKGDYGTSAIDIEAPATGNQYSILAKNNGTGIPLAVQITGAPTAGNSIISAVDQSSNPIFSIRQDGDIYTTGRMEFTPASRPTVSACGTSPSANNSNNQAGIITAGTGTVTSCQVNFSAPFQQTPACVVFQEAGAPALYIANKGPGFLVVNSVAGSFNNMATFNFDYQCVDQP